MSKKCLLIDEFHTPLRRNFLRRHIVHGYDLWQADAFLYVIQQKLPLHSHRYRRAEYAWIMPFKIKSRNNMKKAQRFDNLRRWKMSEKFADWQRKGILQLGYAEFLKKRNINHYSTYSVMKASVVERFNCRRKICGNNLRTTKTINGSILPCLVSNYNALKHRTIGMRRIRWRSHDRRQALNHDLQSRKNYRTLVIQSGRFGMRERIQDGLW